MAVDIQVTGLTAQQMQEIAAAFKANYGEPPEGMTDGQYVKKKLLDHIKQQVREVRFKAQVVTERQVSDTVESELGDIE